MCFVGLGEIAGNIINGISLDYFGFRKHVFICMIQMYVAFAMLIYYTLINQFNFLHAAILGFFYGFQDSGVANFCNSLLGF